MPLRLEKIELKDEKVLSNLVQLSVHELSHFTAKEIGEDGLFEFPELDTFLTDPDRTGYFIRIKNKLAGFVLLTGMSEDAPCHEIRDFFILHNYRGLGLGSEIANMVFDEHHGIWKVPVVEGNDGARHFWRKVIRRASARRYAETFLQGFRGTTFEFRYPPDLRGVMPGSYYNEVADDAGDDSDPTL